jgi:membrane dipeptidase
MAADWAEPTDVLVAGTLVVDAHIHGPGLVPQPFRALYRLANRRTMPPDLGFDALAGAGVDGVVVTAVGDPVVTRWYRGSAWHAVAVQLDRLVADIDVVGGRVVLDAAALRAARAAGRAAFVLGVEGADALGADLDRLDQWHARGVRLVVPVHLGHNRIGSAALTPAGYLLRSPGPRRRGRGLTGFGAACVARLNDLGIVIDTSHADRRTTLDMVAASRHPVVASHSGSRACVDFARYLTDEEALAIAGSGGVIGLWPFFYRGRGLPTVDAFTEQAGYLARLVGPAHLCLGTDMNGVPGVMAGYRGETDMPVLAECLRRAGLAPGDVRGVLGANFVRVLATVTGS